MTWKRHVSDSLRYKSPVENIISPCQGIVWSWVLTLISQVYTDVTSLFSGFFPCVYNSSLCHLIMTLNLLYGFHGLPKTGHILTAWVSVYLLLFLERRSAWLYSHIIHEFSPPPVPKLPPAFPSDVCKPC